MPVLHPLHTAGTWRDSDTNDQKPLPRPPPSDDLPSPTLTNPDHILPDSLPQASSPPRLTRRPPSPSYLENAAESSSGPGPAAMGRNKEKLGLMSKKMMLLRSRTGSGHGHNGSTSRSTPSQGSMRDPDFVPSSPVLQDVGNLAPERAQEPEFLRLPESDRRSNSGGSSSSDISGMTAFLAKYGKPEGTSDDEALYENGESPAQAKSQSNGPAELEVDAERRRQQQEEYNSAVLSKRAEQILANAKKRLNVMEGNLRGARDLVAPLTAANLKRATSLGSAASFTPLYSRRYAPNGYDYDDPSQTASRMLHTQYSSPSMARDYLGGHSRGFSETELPERPYTSLEHQRLVIPRSRTPGQPGYRR